jgi:hypothetical protein
MGAMEASSRPAGTLTVAAIAGTTGEMQIPPRCPDEPNAEGKPSGMA